eukprot:gene12726-14698_t
MEDNQVALLAFLATLTFVIFLGFIIFRIWDVIEQRRSPASTMGSGSFKAEISASQKTTDPIYDQIYAAEKQTGTTKAIASDLVTEFLDSVLFASDLHSSPDASWAAFFTSLLQHHRYTAVFFVPTNKFNRTLRWTSLTMGFLLNLFIVTVYFGTFFPDTDDNENCDVYTTKESCLNDEYGVGNTNHCSWNAATLTCGDKRPSRTFVYLILVVLLVVVISITFQVAYDYLLVNVCMRRPRFEDWGIAAASWMGRNAATEENDQTMLASSSARTLLAVPHFRPEAAHDGSSLSVEEEVEQVKTRVGGPGQTVDTTALLVAREEKHSTSFPVLASVTLALPVVFGWAGDVLGLVVLGALLPAFFDALLIMNRYFYSGAGIFIILPYLFVLLVWVFWYFIIQPAFEEVRLQREAEARKATLSSNTHVTAV